MLKMVRNVESKEIYLKWYYFLKKTIRHYVHIIYPRIFNWRNLHTSTSMSLSVSVSMDTDRDIDVDVDIGRWTRTWTGTWGWTWTWADPDVFWHFFHSTIFPPGGLFFPIRRFVPFVVFSIRRFFRSAFLTIRPFVPFDVFSIRCFVPFGGFSIRRFVPFGVLSFDVLSFDVLYFRRLLLRHFVGEPKVSFSHLMQFKSTLKRNPKNMPDSWRSQELNSSLKFSKFNFLVLWNGIGSRQPNFHNQALVCMYSTYSRPVERKKSRYLLCRWKVPPSQSNLGRRSL